MRQTDKPTASYIVEFSISGTHTVRAESEAAARAWVEDTISSNYDAGNYECDYADVTDWEIGDSYEEDEAV